MFNGGAWLRVEGRPVDVHYRDLDDVGHQIAEAREGRFRIERLMFHLAGIPTCIVAAELALNRVLRGSLPRPEYPDKLSITASQRWRADARLTLGYVRDAHAPRGHVADTAGLIATAAAQAAHAVLAGRGEWVTNGKTLLDRAGLRSVDAVVSGLTADPEQLTRATDAAQSLLAFSPGRSRCPENLVPGCGSLAGAGRCRSVARQVVWVVVGARLEGWARAACDAERTWDESRKFSLVRGPDLRTASCCR